MSTENRDLKKAGLKVTVPRLKILSMLGDASGQGDHFSAEDLYQRLRDTGEDIGLATVYRVGAGRGLQRRSDLPAQPRPPASRVF